MARARNLKPGFFKNEDLAECSPWARLCFAGLWTLADREGRLEDRPKRIKGELFAYDSIEVDPLLEELGRHGFILRYKAQDGRGLIQVMKFAEHQNPHHREPESDLPPPQSPGLLPHAKVPEPEAGGGSDGGKAPGKPEAGAACDDTKAQGKPRASPRLSGQDSTLDGGPAVLIPDSGFRIPDPGSRIPVPTAYGLVAKALRGAGIEANPGHLGFRALVDAGATDEEFLAYAPKAKAMDQPFAYLVKTVASERERAKQLAGSIHRGSMPSAQTTVPAPTNPAAAWLDDQAERAREVEAQRQARIARKAQEAQR